MNRDPYTNDPDYEATDIESKYPPPFFPPNAKKRFHPYDLQQRSIPDDRHKAPIFRTDKQIPHSQTITWMSTTAGDIVRDDISIIVGKVTFTNYNEYSMEELAEKLNAERVIYLF